MRRHLSTESSLIAFGENLRTARIRRMMTQKECAARAGIDVKTLRRIERGDPRVSIGKVASLAFAIGLGVEFDTLIVPDEDMVDDLGIRVPARVRLRQ